MKIVVDESVSLAVAHRLREIGHDVLAVAEKPTSGLKDEAVFALAQKLRAVLVTRDHGFTRSMRYPPRTIVAILYIRPGNLKCDDEVRMVERFLDQHTRESYEGALVTIYKVGVKIWRWATKRG